MEQIPIINLENFLKKNNHIECNKVVDSFTKYGIIIVKDNRVNENDNNNFLNMMEQYYEQVDFKKDIRPDYSYQVGLTPELTELPRNHCKKVESLSDKNKPITLCPPELDVKNRFLWRIGDRPKVTNFAELNSEQVIPDNFNNWENIMNTWGNKMLTTVKDVISMLEVGLSLEYNTINKLINNGPHLLAPTGSDFNKYNKLNTVLAGYHYDISFMTIHGKSRFPGLYIWLKNGDKVLVTIPDGCLLIQAGKQLEYITGGNIQAGFHEVIVSPETINKIEEKNKTKESLWRVSSTLFTHIASDVVLEPLRHLRTIDNKDLYKPLYAGNFVREELQKIKLGKI